MATTHVLDGSVLQHTAASAISSGDVVVMGSLLGVALTDIASGETGSVAIKGVFRLPKLGAAVIGQGETLTFDSSADAFDDNQATASSGDVTGSCAVAASPAGSGAETVDVLLTGVPGTVAS